MFCWIKNLYCQLYVLSEEADFAGMSEDAIIDIVVSAIYSDEMLDYLNLNMSCFVSSDIQFCVDGGTHNDFWPGEFVYPKRFVCVGHKGLFVRVPMLKNNS